MRKVPVGGSIAHAYEFLFGRFFQIIGTAWLPAALLGAAYYCYIADVLPMMSAHRGDAAATIGALGLVFASILVFTLIHAVIAISLTQEALGVRKDLTLAHLVIGPRELRLFFGYLRFYLVYIFFGIVVVAICVAAIFAAKTYGAGLAPNLALAGLPIAVVGARVLTVVLIIGFLLSMLRLVFLMAPVAAVEHRTRLSRAWALTHGSTGRIFVVLLLTCFAAFIGALVAIYYLVGPAEFAALFKAVRSMKPGGQSPVLAFYAAHGPLFSAIVAALAVVSGALLAGASAHAYRVTSGHEDPELEDDAALVAPLIAPAVAEEPLPVVPAHDHHHEPAHEDHGHQDHGHDDHAHEDDDSGGDAADDGGHEDHGPGGHDAHGHDSHAGHGPHAAGGHDAHAHAATGDDGETGDQGDHDAPGHDEHDHDENGSGDHVAHGHGGHDHADKSAHHADGHAAT
ncbi:MAG TPA: hypothetical protein VGB91_16480 [Rhizomicrobium sp.]